MARAKRRRSRLRRRAWRSMNSKRWCGGSWPRSCGPCRRRSPGSGRRRRYRARPVAVRRSARCASGCGSAGPAEPVTDWGGKRLIRKHLLLDYYRLHAELDPWRRRARLSPDPAAMAGHDLEHLGFDATGLELVHAVDGVGGAWEFLVEPTPADDPGRPPRRVSLTQALSWDLWCRYGEDDRLWRWPSMPVLCHSNRIQLAGCLGKGALVGREAPEFVGGGGVS
ncbi:MAG: hypothetical protein K0Q60_4977 [Microvirga sp.]|nr:hypothetical protein [Microvirga sp.]